jgi:hypothetical protein
VDRDTVAGRLEDCHARLSLALAVVNVLLPRREPEAAATAKAERDETVGTAGTEVARKFSAAYRGPHDPVADTALGS